jgi:glucosyl-dolichyl phosphate glucuronosyltransferase
MRLSVIIPTHNRPATLRACLDTLQRQQGDPAALEVVVVDDGSEPEMAPLVAEVAASGPVPMRCERQPTSGLNSARNRGVRASFGDVVAFLDDDTLVSPGWAGAMLAAFSGHPCSAVGGRVELQLAGPEPDWMRSRRNFLAEYDLGSEAVWLDQQPVPVGANCAVRRTEFERIGGFRAGLDRIGRSLVSNGDTEFFARLKLSDGRLRYEPAAHVLHCVPADRLTVRYFARRYYAQGVSDELLFADRGLPVSRRGRIGRARYVAAGAVWVSRDVLGGRGAFDGWFNMQYWAGRLAAYGKAPPGGSAHATASVAARERAVDQRPDPRAEPPAGEPPRKRREVLGRGVDRVGSDDRG